VVPIEAKASLGRSGSPPGGLARRRTGERSWTGVRAGPRAGMLASGKGDFLGCGIWVLSKGGASNEFAFGHRSNWTGACLRIFRFAWFCVYVVATTSGIES
jgi:hypothetical protein